MVGGIGIEPVALPWVLVQCGKVQSCCGLSVN